MARGGSIHERRLANGSTAYIIMWRVDGRQIKQTVRGTRREAEAALTRVLAARDRGEQRSVDTATFASHADAWLASKRARVEPASLVVYRQHLERRLVPAFGHLKLRQITRGRIEAYLAELDDAGVDERKTANESLGPLRQILARALREGLIASNPAVSNDRDAPLELPYDAPAIRPLTAQQAKAYLLATPTWYRPLAEVLIALGAAHGEALALEWRDVTGFAGTLHRTRVKRGKIGTPKGDRARSVAVDSGRAWHAGRAPETAAG